MTDQRELDRLLGAFFVEGTDELADRVIDAALDQIDHTDQRRAVRMPRRFQTMNMPTRVAAAAVIAVLAVGGAFYLTRPDQPAVGGPSPEPSASQIASAPANPSASPSLAGASPSLAVVQPREPSWIATGDMIEARMRQTATLLPDGKVLVAGGGGIKGDGIFAVASAELYDPSTRSWTATGNMATVREGHTATLLPDGKVLVAGGHDGNVERLSSAELYDPSSGSWTATGNMAKGRAYHTATLLPDGKVLVAGGWGRNQRPLSSAELYDPSSRSWTATENMDATRAGQTATLLPDGKVLVVGGATVFDVGGYRGEDSLASAELYDPGSGSWTATGNMALPREGHTATLLPNGKVLVAGSQSIEPTTAELYHPGSGSWTSTGPTDGIRNQHTATLLLNGKVLLAGSGDRNGPSVSAELYDPSTGSWAAAQNMITPRSNHTATLLPDGRVLVAGGTFPDTFVFLSASTELYDPGSGD